MANDRIETNPHVMGGKPVIRGTRITVEFVRKLLAETGWADAEILENYPQLTAADLAAVRAFAKEDSNG